MTSIQTNTVKKLAKRLTRQTVPLRPNVVVGRLVKHALGQKPISVHEIKVGDINRVFRVKTRDHEVIARMQFYRDYRKHYRREYENMQVARELGVLVPKSLAMGRWKRHSYMILDYIHARDTSHLNPLKSWQELGRMARSLSKRLWPTTPRKWNDYVEKIVQTVSHDDIIVRKGVLTREEYDAALSLVAGLAALRIDRVFQHGDLKPEHIIIDDRGHYWLLDWASAGGYPRDYALAQVYCNAVDDRHFKAFRYGYGVSEEEWEDKRAKLRPLIASILLRKIFWHVHDKRKDEETLGRFVRRLRDTLTSAESSERLEPVYD